MALQASKILLKESTKMSLHERFTVYRQQSDFAAGSVRQKMQQQRQASVKNQRLAQQMANRPSVIAALKIKRKSLKQRLGNVGLGGTTGMGRSMQVTGVKARLSMGARQNIQNRLGRGGRVLSLRGGIRKTGRGGGQRLGTSPMLKARLGNQIFSRNFQPRTRQGQNRAVGRASFRRGRGFNRGFGRQQRGGGNRGQQFRSNPAPRGRGGRNRGRGSLRKGFPSKQDLDNQLDEYMAQTKSHLDAQLDAYMAAAE